MLDAGSGSTETMCGMGWQPWGSTGVLVPEEFDGAGMTMVEAGVVAEELGAALYPGPWSSSAVAATRALLHTGAAADDAALLTEIAGGTTIATVGPLGGARPSAIETDNGTILRGEITGLADAAVADVILVLADELDGAALYAVDASSTGVDSAACAHVDPTRKLSDVEFAARPLGGWRRRLPTDRRGRRRRDDRAAADAVGAAAAVMNLAIEYAKVRRQFDQPIGSFQAIQHLCVDMYEAVELARSGVIHALWAADAAEPAERHLAALRAKAFAGRWPRSATPRSRSSAGSASPGSTTLTSTSNACWAGVDSSGHRTDISKKSARRWRGSSELIRPERVVVTGVLHGVRVVELASWTYVPSAGAALADWGADVIKVEDVKAGDPGRALVIGGFTKEAPGRISTSFSRSGTGASAASPSTSSPKPGVTTSAACWPPPTCS